MIPGDLVRSEYDNTQLWTTTTPKTKDDMCGKVRTSEVVLVICKFDDDIDRDWLLVLTSQGALGWARPHRFMKA